MEKIFAFLKSDSDKADLDWKQRARTNVERMTQGGMIGLAEVVKGLQVLSELRPLPDQGARAVRQRAPPAGGRDGRVA